MNAIQSAADVERQLVLLTAPGRGGARPGAGRPRTPAPLENVTFRVERSEVAEIERRAAATGESVSEFLRRVVRHELRHRDGQATRERKRREQAG